MEPLIAPSILSCDFGALTSELAKIADADMAHVDVMDSHFVPNLTFGLPVVERIIEASPIPIDAHLMIADPDRWAPQYAEMGCHSVSFHVEAASAPVRLARELRRHGAKACAALCPATPVEPFIDLLSELDALLIMTVEPGFGGQEFLDVCLPKIRRARAAISERELDVWISVDGGVNTDTIERCAEAGANVFVAGSAVYGAANPAAAISDLRAQAASAS